MSATRPKRSGEKPNMSRRGFLKLGALLGAGWVAGQVEKKFSDTDVRAAVKPETFDSDNTESLDLTDREEVPKKLVEHFAPEAEEREREYQFSGERHVLREELYEYVLSGRIAQSEEDYSPVAVNEDVDALVDAQSERFQTLRFDTVEQEVEYWKPITEQYTTEYEEAVREATTEFSDVPPWIVYGVLGVESHGDPDAYNKRSGALGPMQMLPTAAREADLIVNEEQDERTDIKKSVLAGVKHLSKLHDRFGQWGLALVAYSHGSAKLVREIHATFPHVDQQPDWDEYKNQDEGWDTFKSLRDDWRDALGGYGVNAATLLQYEHNKESGKIRHSREYPFFVEAAARRIELHMNK